jgi:hypothetical protein
MNKMTVDILGINYLNVGSMRDQPKYVLAPNGRRADEKIPPHFASIFVEEARCEGDNWWEDERRVRELSIFNLRGEQVKVNVIEFRIPAPFLARTVRHGARDARGSRSSVPLST